MRTILALGAALALTTATIAAEPLYVSGSSTVDPFAKEVVGAFVSTTGLAAPVISSDGTGGGMKIFCAGDSDITKASRAMKSSEAETCARNEVEFTELYVGADGIVLATNAGDVLDNLTQAQIYKAFVKDAMTPAPTRWNEISDSLPGTPIYGIFPPGTSGTRDAVEELAFEAGCEMVHGDGATQCENIELRTNVAETGTETDTLTVQSLKLRGDGAVAVFGYTYLLNADGIEAVTINDVGPSGETIADESYPLSRPLYLYPSHDAIAAGAPVLAYLQTFYSNRAMNPVTGILPRIGLIPPSEERLVLIRTSIEELAGQTIAW